jgi:hypothetical protein
MNLSLYAVNAFIVLDSDGHRVLAKYYSPKARTQLGEPDPNKGLTNLKEQRAFEKGLFAKTKKPGGALRVLSGLCHGALPPYISSFKPFSLAQVILYCTMDTCACTSTR